MGIWEHGTLGAWDSGRMGFGAMGVWKHGTFRGWDFQSVGLLECGTLGAWDFLKKGQIPRYWYSIVVS